MPGVVQKVRNAICIFGVPLPKAGEREGGFSVPSRRCVMDNQRAKAHGTRGRDSSVP